MLLEHRRFKLDRRKTERFRALVGGDKGSHSAAGSDLKKLKGEEEPASAPDGRCRHHLKTRAPRRLAQLRLREQFLFQFLKDGFIRCPGNAFAPDLHHNGDR